MQENPTKYKYDDSSSADVVTQNAAHLSVIELAGGTALHVLHVPFSGHVLSLNEGGFLAHTSFRSSSRLRAIVECYEVAAVAATLKSLSLAGKKLGPMLSIMMQGFCFCLGIAIFGRRRLGAMVGMVFLCVWAFIQPLLTLLVSFGPSEMTQVIHFYSQKLDTEYAWANAAVVTVILSLFVLKIALGLALVLWISSEKGDSFRRFSLRWSQKSWINGAPIRPAAKSTFAGALKDLRSPLFLLSIALTWVFLFLQQESWSQMVWMALRPLAVGFVVFYLLRSPWFLQACSKLVDKVGVLRPVHRRLQKVNALLGKKSTLACVALAAGQSSRMGRNKMLLPWNHSTVIHHVCQTLLSVEFAQTVLVIGHDGEQIRAAVSDLDRLQIENNDNYASGMMSSIQAGLRALREPCSAVLIFLCDQPTVSVEEIQLLIKIFQEDPEALVVAPQFLGQRGNPVLISTKFRDEILARPVSDRGCAFLFEKYPQACRLVEIRRNSVLVDLDTPQDYESLHAGN